MSCDPVVIELTCEIADEASGRLTGTLVDDAGAPIDGSVLDNLTATLFDKKSKTILNGRDHVNAFTQLGATVSALGALVLHLQPADNAVHVATRDEETHVLMLEWDWTAASGQKYGKAEIEFVVRNFSKVT